jgi:hypothetical protein
MTCDACERRRFDKTPDADLHGLLRDEPGIGRRASGCCPSSFCGIDPVSVKWIFGIIRSMT